MDKSGGWYNHQRDGNRVYSVSTTGYSPNTWEPTFAYYWNPFSLHTIAFGGCSDEATAPSKFQQRKGDLNAGPLGLGYLAVGGYMGDVRALYCPSAGKLPRLRTAYPGGAAANLLDYNILGGFDGESLTHGDYRAVLKANIASTSGVYAQMDKGRVNSHATSHYSYRGMPLDNIDDRSPRTNIINYYPGVTPVISMDMASNWQNLLGRPVFKTTRALGGRAIASDFFGRWEDPSNTAVALHARTGGGLWMHREGYNVLYGDSSARWYGDPTQSVIWQRRARYTGTAPVDSYEWAASGFQMVWYNPHADRGVLVWHIFDEAAGIDVGALK